MTSTAPCRSITAALITCALLASCRDGSERDVSKAVREVSFKEYAEPQCWFREGEELEALLVVAGQDEEERIPWFVSSKCIAKEDMPSYGSATLLLLGDPRVADRQGLLRRHVDPRMGPDNLRLHLPPPDSNSPIYYITAHLEPSRKRPRSFEITAVTRVVPTGVRFLDLLDMGPAERSSLVARVSKDPLRPDK